MVRKHPRGESYDSQGHELTTETDSAGPARSMSDHYDKIDDAGDFTAQIPCKHGFGKTLSIGPLGSGRISG